MSTIAFVGCTVKVIGGKIRLGETGLIVKENGVVQVDGQDKAAVLVMWDSDYRKNWILVENLDDA